MTKRTRRTHSPAFKAKVELSAIKGEKALAELANLFCVRSDQCLEGAVAGGRGRSARCGRVVLRRLALSSAPSCRSPARPETVCIEPHPLRQFPCGA